MNTFSALPEDDSRRLVGMAACADYRDPFWNMSRTDLGELQGKLVAMLQDTGQIIAVAATHQELEEAVARTEFAGQRWWFRSPPPVADDGVLRLPPLPDQQP